MLCRDGGRRGEREDQSVGRKVVDGCVGLEALGRRKQVGKLREEEPQITCF